MFLKWKETFENKCLNADILKTQVMVSGGITLNCLSESWPMWGLLLESNG